MYLFTLSIIQCLLSVHQAYGIYEIQFTGQDGEVNLGAKVTLQCTVTVPPIPERMAITKNLITVQEKYKSELNGMIAENETGILYNIYSVTNASAGDYTCSAVWKLLDDRYHVVNSTYRLTVRALRAPSEAVEIVPSTTLVIKGQTLEIRCNTSDRGNPPAHFKWYKLPDTDVPIQSSINQSFVLETKTIQQSGHYFCQAENSEGVSNRSSLVHIMVEEQSSNGFYRRRTIIIGVTVVVVLAILVACIVKRYLNIRGRKRAKPMAKLPSTVIRRVRNTMMADSAPELPEKPESAESEAYLHVVSEVPKKPPRTTIHTFSDDEEDYITMN